VDVVVVEFVSTTESLEVLRLKVGCVDVVVVLAVHVHGIVFSTSGVRFIYDEDKTQRCFAERLSFSIHSSR